MRLVLGYLGALIFRILRMCKSVFHNDVSLTEDGLNHILLRHPELKRMPNLENEIVRPSTHQSMLSGDVMEST